MAITLLTTSGFFFPPALMIGLIESGEIIRDMTARRTARANLDLLDSLGKVARVERDGVESRGGVGRGGGRRHRRRLSGRPDPGRRHGHRRRRAGRPAEADRRVDPRDARGRAGRPRRDPAGRRRPAHRDQAHRRPHARRRGGRPDEGGAGARHAHGGLRPQDRRPHRCSRPWPWAGRSPSRPAATSWPASASSRSTSAPASASPSRPRSSPRSRSRRATAS